MEIFCNKILLNNFEARKNRKQNTVKQTKKVKNKDFCKIWFFIVVCFKNR